ncbi:MAG: sulfurtransferase complex subunit TusB [Gammaproteobacteria bacterium]|nr:sulfurtransferase complex subunit TusB [Gammaproteobacteria bacterium]MDD9958638.1 sulfurtransferase complex subunit TusB [Gammaproteobacteria bacterium]
MSSLHTISKSPRFNLLESCLSAVSEGDSIIFIEDGVYHCNESELLAKLLSTSKCYGLKEDLSARGLEVKVDVLQIISYRKFVELCASHEKIISWF